jgi:hypothetical protein
LWQQCLGDAEGLCPWLRLGSDVFKVEPLAMMPSLVCILLGVLSGRENAYHKHTTRLQADWYQSHLFPDAQGSSKGAPRAAGP